jgi:peroxiredoxin Q/BCP
MVELRKRKTPPPAPVRPAKKKSAKAEKPKESVAEKAKAAVTQAVETVKEAVAGDSNGQNAAKGSPKVGESIDLAGFGGEVETHDGKKTSLAKLVEESKSGVVLFTYPKASTPGCTPPPSSLLIHVSLTGSIQAPSKSAFSATRTRP